MRKLVLLLEQMAEIGDDADSGDEDEDYPADTGTVVADDEDLAMAEAGQQPEASTKRGFT